VFAVGAAAAAAAAAAATGSRGGSAFEHTSGAVAAMATRAAMAAENTTLFSFAVKPKSRYVRPRQCIQFLS
jgi:hypothetical protein